MVRTMRPKQWSKNVLLLAAPFTAGVIGQPGTLTTLGAAVGAFCLISSGGYFINDACDRDTDRHHPRKRNRPVAAGIVPAPAAYSAAVLLTAFGLGVAAHINQIFLLCAAAYTALSFTYSFAVKQLAIIELGVVAAAFLLRGAAGAFAVGIEISPAFMVTVGAGALLVAAGKRAAELPYGPPVRPVLTRYDTRFLDMVGTTAGAVAAASYTLWAFTNHSAGNWVGWVSVVPFTLALVHYRQLCRRGNGGEPEEVLLWDRRLQSYMILTVGVLLIAQ
jgi:decaprenyl-phosphate phosphoribosyltransferase